MKLHKQSLQPLGIKRLKSVLGGRHNVKDSNNIIVVESGKLRDGGP